MKMWEKKKALRYSTCAKALLLKKKKEFLAPTSLENSRNGKTTGRFVVSHSCIAP